MPSSHKWQIDRLVKKKDTKLEQLRAQHTHSIYMPADQSVLSVFWDTFTRPLSRSFEPDFTKLTFSSNSYLN